MGYKVGQEVYTKSRFDLAEEIGKGMTWSDDIDGEPSLIYFGVKISTFMLKELNSPRVIQELLSGSTDNTPNFVRFQDSNYIFPIQVIREVV